MPTKSIPIAVDASRGLVGHPGRRRSPAPRPPHLRPRCHKHDPLPQIRGLLATVGVESQSAAQATLVLEVGDPDGEVSTCHLAPFTPSSSKADRRRKHAAFRSAGPSRLGRSAPSSPVQWLFEQPKSVRRLRPRLQRLTHSAPPSGAAASQTRQLQPPRLSSPVATGPNPQEVLAQLRSAGQAIYG